MIRARPRRLVPALGLLLAVLSSACGSYRLMPVINKTPPVHFEVNGARVAGKWRAIEAHPTVYRCACNIISKTQKALEIGLGRKCRQ